MCVVIGGAFFYGFVSFANVLDVEEVFGLDAGALDEAADEVVDYVFGAVVDVVSEVSNDRVEWIVWVVRVQGV